MNLEMNRKNEFKKIQLMPLMNKTNEGLSISNFWTSYDKHLYFTFRMSQTLIKKTKLLTTVSMLLLFLTENCKPTIY